MKGAILTILALAALLGWEAVPADAPQDAPRPAAETRIVAPPAEAAPVAHWAEVVLARPLFATDRRPPPVTEASAAAPEVLPRLTGTIRADDRLLAIFAVEDAPHPLVVARDGTVAGWTVTDIADATVTLQRDGRTVVARVGFARLAPVPVQPPLQTDVLLHERRSSAFLQP